MVWDTTRGLAKRLSISPPLARPPGRAARSSTTTPSRCSTGTATSAPTGGEPGLFHEGTRFLSHFELLFDGPSRCPRLHGEGHNIHYRPTSPIPDVYLDDRIVLLKDTVHIARALFLWRRLAAQRIALANYGPEPVDPTLSLRFASDFADIFEVRGVRRERRGRCSWADRRRRQLTLSLPGARRGACGRRR